MALVTFITHVVTDAANLESGWSVLFAMIGALFFFILSEYFTEAGFFVHSHHISKATPGCVWKLAGVIWWLIAAGIVIYHA